MHTDSPNKKTPTGSANYPARHTDDEILSALGVQAQEFGILQEAFALHGLPPARQPAEDGVDRFYVARSVAFNAGNLLPVVQAVRAKYPALRIILAADDDWRTEGNPGLSKATAAAQAVGGLLGVPQFPPEQPDKATDFNCLHRVGGAVTLRDAAQPRRRGKNGDQNA
jgi:hypothetical protein